RRQAVEWLAAEYDRATAARDLLRQALQSRHRKVVTDAAFALAVKKDPAAFDALVRLLRDAKEEGPQRRPTHAPQEPGHAAASRHGGAPARGAPGGGGGLAGGGGGSRRGGRAAGGGGGGGGERGGGPRAGVYAAGGSHKKRGPPGKNPPPRRGEKKHPPRH